MAKEVKVVRVDVAALGPLGCAARDEEAAVSSEGVMAAEGVSLSGESMVAATIA